MSSPLHRPVRAVTGVGIMFASNGFAFASLLPWYPLFAKELQLSATQFGFIVAAFAVGSVLSSAAPTPLIARWGALRVGVVGTALLGFGIAAAAWAPSGLVLAITLATVGLFDAIVDVAQNV
ncbi:MAG: MFS transporter, partial [Mycetocola sp.]